LFGFHPLDIFFAVIALYFIIRGCRRGFAGEIISLAAFVCAFVFSLKWSSEIGGIVEFSWGINKYFSQVLAIILIWFVIMLIAMLLRLILKQAISAIHLGSLDTLLGIFSGFLKFSLVVYCFLIAGLILTPVFNPTWMTNSDVIRYAGRHWPVVRKVIVDRQLMSNAEKLPDGTLEQILRPYRTGNKGPR